MAEASSIVLQNNAAANVTFTPESVSPALSVFVDRTAGVALGFNRLRIGTQFAQGKSVVNKSRYSVELPVTQVVDGVTRVAYTLRANLELILPDLATDTNRKDLYAFVKNGLANALITGAMRDLDPLY